MAAQMQIFLTISLSLSTFLFLASYKENAHISPNHCPSILESFSQEGPFYKFSPDTSIIRWQSPLAWSLPMTPAAHPHKSQRYLTKEQTIYREASTNWLNKNKNIYIGEKITTARLVKNHLLRWYQMNLLQRVGNKIENNNIMIK